MQPTIKTLQLKGLSPNPRNPQAMTEPQRAALRRSIEAFGCVEPIVVNGRSGRVAGGHQRLAALLELGESEAPCVVVDLDDDRERALALALNKIHGQFDDEKLRAVLAEFSADFDAALSGFEPEEIRALLDQTIEPQQDDFDFDAVVCEIAEPTTKPGDLWRLGGHRLLCGDALSEAHMARLMGGERARLALTDPPYGVDYEAFELGKPRGYRGRTREKIRNDSISPENFRGFLRVAFQRMHDHAEDGAAIYVFHAEATRVAFSLALAEARWDEKQTIIWVKNHFSLGRQDYHYRHEPILYGWKPGAAHYFAPERTHATVLDPEPPPDPAKLKKQELQALAARLLADREAAPQSVLRADKPLRSAEHPTMKPVPLLGQLIRNSSQPGWPVLDPFAGSGSTLAACEQLGRRAFCCELEPKFCDAILRRWELATGRKAEKIA